MLSLSDAKARILGLARPVEPIEVALTEAVGLVLAEALTADVDLPTFDRAASDGYAVRAADAPVGARLRVVGPAPGGALRPAGRAGRRGGPGSAFGSGSALLDPPTAADILLGPGETAHVNAGTPMPVGADAVVRTEDTRPDTGAGPPREVVVLRPTEAGHGVVPRGYYLRAGVTIAPAGARLQLPMVGLLAAEGCTHPVCHRRVRVAVLAVGDHLVGPGEAPVMHRERNAAGLAVVAPCLNWGATAHDLGTVTARELPSALMRALTASVVVVLGEPDGIIPRALEMAGVELEFDGVSIHPGKRVRYGVVRDPAGRGAHHVFHVAPGPVAATSAVALLVGPLIARLQGGPDQSAAPTRAVWSGPPHRLTDDRLWAVPVSLAISPDARLTATPLPHRGKDDLVGFSRAEALALIPPRTGPTNAGDLVDVVPLSGWPPTAPV